MLNRKRKTIDIDGIVRHANFYLSNGGTSQEERLGVIMLLEACLNRAGQYKGFNYLSDKEVEGIPGIWSDRDEDTRFDGTDNTRRVYIYG